jgi:glycosyltransferase involved in cell wall biosynthesis
MKIAQIVCAYPPYKSGISTSALNTARVFSSAGHEAVTFTLDCGGKNYPLLRGLLNPETSGVDCAAQDGVCFGGGEAIYLKALPGIGNGGFLPQLFWRLRNFDVVYLHYPFFGAAEIVWFLKKFFWKNKVKLIIYFHMEPEFSSPLLKFLSLPSRLIYPSLFKQADSIVCASIEYAEANMPAGVFTANKNKIKEIPFSVDTERFKPVKFVIPTEPELAKASGGTACSQHSFKGSFDSANASLRMTKIFKILFVGGLDKAHYFKGVNVLLNSLNLLNKENLNWQLTIVGSGDLQPQYEKQARDLNIADKVIFAGNVSEAELPKKYQEADCLVLPSINKGEAFGIVLLDAMATGIPVIASDLPGVRQVFTEASGLKIKPGDVEDLFEKIKFLLENPAKRREMGAVAREEVKEKYCQEKVENKLTDLLLDY